MPPQSPQGRGRVGDGAGWVFALVLSVHPMTGGTKIDIYELMHLSNLERLIAARLHEVLSINSSSVGIDTIAVDVDQIGQVYGDDDGRRLIMGFKRHWHDVMLGFMGERSEERELTRRYTKTLEPIDARCKRAATLGPEKL